MRDFRKLDIWKNGRDIVKIVYEISDQLPNEERFGLRSQITRAAVSIPSNIAVGCGRNSKIEFYHWRWNRRYFALFKKEAKMIHNLINRIKNS